MQSFVLKPTGAALGGGDGGGDAGFFSVALNIFLSCEMCSMFMCLHVNQGGELTVQPSVKSGEWAVIGGQKSAGFPSSPT